MKRFFTALAVCALALPAFAETAPADSTAQTETREVVGAVIDESGNPLPGALLKSKKGVETTADADGTFKLILGPKDKKITATYPGLRKTTKGTKKQPVVFEMKNQRSFTAFWDLGYTSLTPDFTSGVNFMFGIYWRWGFGIRLGLGEEANVTGQLIRRINNKVAINLGFGLWSKEREYGYYYNYGPGGQQYYHSEYETYTNPMADLGVILKFGHFSLTPGISGYFGGYGGVGGYLGVGYTFGR